MLDPIWLFAISLLSEAAEAMARIESRGVARQTIACWQEPMRARAGHETVDAWIDEKRVSPLEEIVAVAGGLRVSDRPRETALNSPSSLMVAMGSIA